MTPPTAPGSPAPGDQGGMLGVTGRCFVQFLNLNAQSDTQDPTAAKSEWKTAPTDTHTSPPPNRTAGACCFLEGGAGEPPESSGQRAGRRPGENTEGGQESAMVLS